MLRLVVYKLGYGRFTLYFRQSNSVIKDLEYLFKAIVKLEHLIQCLKKRKVSSLVHLYLISIKEARGKYNIKLDEEAHKFFLGNGHNVIGARD